MHAFHSDLLPHWEPHLAPPTPAVFHCLSEYILSAWFFYTVLPLHLIIHKIHSCSVWKTLQISKYKNTPLAIPPPTSHVLSAVLFFPCVSL